MSASLSPFVMISIHALREEGDRVTPPQNRRTKTMISIHALREEGDSSLPSLSPSGGIISIHALREEGDGCGGGKGHNAS